MTDKTKVTLTIARIVGILIFLITVIAMAATWKAEIEFKIDSTIQKVEIHDAYVEGLKKDVTTILNDVQWIKKELGGE